jgi:cellulose synthase/poly-beta-1,6-N-acetylglucosamine synthase-like glycosyltransferase
VISFLLFPASVVLVLALLAAYHPRLSVNEVFARHRRPPILKTVIGLWFVVFLAVVVVVSVAQFQVYGEIWKQLVSSASLIHIMAALGLVLLLACEAVVVVYWFVYMAYCWIGLIRYKLPVSPPLAGDAPGVVVLIACCDEDARRLERSVSSVARLGYPNLKCYLVENSRDPERKAEAMHLAERHGIQVVHVPNRGHKAGAVNDAMKLLDLSEPYFAIIDADHKVIPEFLSEIVPLLEADPGLAFVQTPQFHENESLSRLTIATSQQEMLPYDSVLEGKGAMGRVHCCGTNFVMRMRALKEVGGWDEGSITKEDTITSYRIHCAGWRSCYVRKAYAFGLGPETLSDYWTGQSKWAFGNTRILRLVLSSMMTKKQGRVPLAIALDYLWTTGFYATTLALAGFSILPVLIWMLPMHADRILYTYAIYGMIVLFPYINMRLRGYSVRNLLLLNGLLSLSASCYFSGVIKGFSGKLRNGTSQNTYKRFGERNVWLSLRPYIFIGLLVCGSLALRGTISHPTSPYPWILLAWLFNYSIFTGHFLHFQSTTDYKVDSDIE